MARGAPWGLPSNPFNGIERLCKHMGETMERYRKNPFNGIERDVLGVVLADTVLANRNPFNGIERIRNVE